MDIAPELLKNIQDAFEVAYRSDGTIAQLLYLIESGNATYKEAEEYAVRCGELLADVFGENLSSDVLPDGRMYFNIADRVIKQPLEAGYQLVADAAAQVQQALNEAAGIRIRPQVPELEEDRLKGIIDKVSGADRFDDVAWMLDEPVVNFHQNVVDRSIRENADFHAKSGFRAKIVRTAEGGACVWCQALAGTYDYEEVSNTGNNVFRRHERCRCTIQYFPEKGKFQDVRTKRWYNEDGSKLNRRREVGLQENKLTAAQRERGLIAMQSGGKASIPPQMEGDFSDFVPLTISKEERATLSELHELSKKNGYEYGRVIYEDEVSDIFTSKQKGGIEIPVKIDAENVKVYHSHTNDTPQSHTDLRWMTNPKISEVTVVTNNEDVFSVKVGNGWVPTREEFDGAYFEIARQVDEDVQKMPGFADMSYEERTYVAIREQAFRLSRHFEWTMSGGKLNGE